MYSLSLGQRDIYEQYKKGNVIFMDNMKLSDGFKNKGAVGFFEKRIGVNDQVGFFGIARHVSLNDIEIERDVYRRCDAGSYTGPQGLHIWNGTTCNCGSTQRPDPLSGNHQIRFDNMTAIFPVIEALPYGHIMYFELNNAEEEIEAIELSHSECARTLQEVFRLLLEWDFAYTELGNREITAEVSHGIVSVLQIPEEFKEWLISQVPPEKVGRFLSGDTNARERSNISSIPSLDDEFSKWLYDKISSVRAIGAYDEDGI